MVTRPTSGPFSSNPFLLSRRILAIARERDVVTRSELIDATGAGKSIVVQRVGELVAAGLLRDGAKAASTGGRAPQGVTFNGTGALLVGVHVAASRIDVVITDYDGRRRSAGSVANDVTAGPAPTLEAVVAAVRAAIAGLPPGSPPVLGVGVGLPAPVDPEAGCMVAPPGMPEWDGVPVAALLGDALGLDVHVDNDVNATAVGELSLGQLAGHRDVVVVTVAAGIGAALLLDGRIHRGRHGAAGDIGHVALGDSRVACSCGRTGCLAASAGGVALAREAVALAREGRAPLLAPLLDDAEPPELDVLARALALGDPGVGALVRRAGERIGRVLAFVAGIVNPSLVVLTGELGTSEVLAGAVRSTLLGNAPVLAGRDLLVRTSRLGAASGALGAALLAGDEILTADRIRRWVESGRSGFVVEDDAA